ncbi:MAG: 2-amino-4-hydroxy-6-hydroxymethyldihydropteridine diphosphokinase [Xanthomonadales bacterium]|nr:2-amino-4-hydroxy-6-hydroxymethyldihydropteridine diphosphokinase [Xanthomonadales bacterium]
MNRVLAHVGLGSNLDGPAMQVERAIVELAAMPSTRLVRRSRLFRTPPWGLSQQPEFVNAVAEVETGLAPIELLGELLAIERRGGRVRDGVRWGPRSIDLDLLLYGARSGREPGLELPHPRMHERAFVLVPLSDLDPDLQIPGRGRVGDLAAAIGAGGCEPL